MFNLCCLFCGELLSVTELRGQCLGCGAQYAITVQQECVKRLDVVQCGRLCTCEASHKGQ